MATTKLSRATKARTTTRNRVATTGGTKRGSSLQTAQKQVARLRNRVKNLNLSHKEGIAAAVSSLSTQGSLFATAALAGYRGPDGLDIWNVDGRLIVGGGLATYGLIQSFTGESMSGNYALAVGNGVLASLVYELGHNMGANAAEDKTDGVRGVFGRDVHVTPDFSADAHAAALGRYR